MTDISALPSADDPSVPLEGTEEYLSTETAPLGELTAVVLSTLFSPVEIPPTALDRAVIDVALDWQNLGPHAHTAEIHGSLSLALEGRMTEIFGRAAAAGEQLGLAVTCLRDASRWLVDSGGGFKTGIAARALAELAGYYALSAAHGLGNVTLRALLLNTASRAVIISKYKDAKEFPPFTDNGNAWPAFSPTMMNTLRNASRATGEVSVDVLVDAVDALLKDSRWSALQARRHGDFHRWRPQSVEGGVPLHSPWTHSNGERTMSIGMKSDYVVPDHHALVSEATDAVTALSEAMKAWLSALPEGLRDLGVPVLKT